MGASAMAVEPVAMTRRADTTQVSVRIKPEWVSVADAIAAKLSRPGLDLARADAYRLAMARGFEELRRELGLEMPAAPVDAPAPKKSKPKK